MSVRVGVCLNAGAHKGQPQAALVLAPPHSVEALLLAASNKLRLKKRDVKRARLFIWRSGVELPREGSAHGMLANDDLVAICLGEPYAGPIAASASASDAQPVGGEGPASASASAELEAPPLEPAPLIRGADDCGREYGSLAELWAEQARRAAEYRTANDAWWDADGYGGDGDEEAMIGDGSSEADVAHSARLLEALRETRPQLALGSALDGGAGIGRVSKHVLLKRCSSVCLLEPCERWLKQSRRYLGNKRAQRCSFVCARLEDHRPPPGTYDLVWLQWCLQYLIDAHVVLVLRQLSASLSTHGVLIVKENRPFAAGKEGSFQVDTPEGANARHDVTRPDEHHRWLFGCAGLAVERWEHADEVTAWVLRPDAAEGRRRREAPPPVPPCAEEL